MRTRFYLYFSKHKAQDQYLYRLIRKIPERQRNREIKHILLNALSSRSKHPKSGKPSPPVQIAPDTIGLLDLDSKHRSTTQIDVQENPPTSNPLVNLQHALNKIPLKEKG